jgi:hypothetical protein
MTYKVCSLRQVMRGILKYLIFILLIAAAGCERTGSLKGFLKPVPVEPLSDVIRTAVPIGCCAMIAMADQLGFPVPFEKIPAPGEISAIRITPWNGYPLIYMDASCEEITILSFPADDDFAILSIFFKLGGTESTGKKYLEVHTIPAMIDEGKIKAVFASQDIYVRDSIEISLQMGPADIRIAIDRAETPRPETSEAAIRQNAWIIDVDAAGTWDDFSDDRYTITGGEQDISVLTGRQESNSDVMQLAMIGTLMQPDCLLSPVEGFAVLRQIGVKTGEGESLQDLVLGTVIYNFTSSCTGSAEIRLATGNFVASTGKNVDLGLLK